MSDYLMVDLLSEILVRATAETLVRCTSVCKRWNSIITSPAFIKTHLNQQKTRDYLMVRNCPIGSEIELYSWYIDDATFTMCGQQTPMNQDWEQFHQIVGSCNGILSLANSTNDMFLWNPAIRKWFNLPPHPFKRVVNYMKLQLIGFGFDVTSDDYKVITTVRDLCSSMAPPKVFMYSLNFGTWKDVSHLGEGIRHLCFGEEDKQPFVNGATHWLASDSILNQGIVLAFHMSDEVFRHIKLPIGYRFSELLVIDGLLSVFEDDYFTNKCIIWRMEEYGVVSSWTKYIYLEYSEKPTEFIGVKNKFEVLVDIDSAIRAYDPNAKEEDATDQPKDLGICSGHGVVQVEPFVESLVFFRRPTNNDMVVSRSLNTEEETLGLL